MCSDYRDYRLETEVRKSLQEEAERQRAKEAEQTEETRSSVGNSRRLAKS